ncbi:MAG TPA: lytic transglycosylase domain-containing protein [Acetobacteraceae bacterium]|nr:lytic transglycosylase domain-containing protein [Acetobacteraceae bacterium]
MRGLDHTRSRLPAARAFFAGVAILAGAFAPAAQASGNDETAMAVPRVALPDGNAGVALPQPLSPSDAVLVRRAFALQKRGDLSGADRAIADLQSDLLLGHLRAERLLGRFHRATAGELTAWLDRYASQPDAPAIRALLLRRLPKGAAVPPLPAIEAIALPRPSELPASSAVTEPAPMPRRPALERAVAARLQHGGPQSALRLIDTSPGLAPAYAALLRGEVVRALFTRNDDAQALHVALLALRATPPDRDVGLAAYVGGLAAWRLGRLTEARRLFATAAEAPVASPRQLAAAAFWSARAADRQHDPADAARWLHRAAAERTTLHGLIARRLLGLPTGIVPSSALLSQADVDAIAAMEGGWRAFALLQAGQPEQAADELLGLWPAVKNDPALRRALLLVAAGVGLPDCAAQLAAWSEAAEPGAGEASRFALPRLRPAGGFRVDPALVYALTRVESNFDPGAVSPAGARGLMQLMPVTARYVERDPARRGPRLHDPAVNLELGQRYVLLLAAREAVGGNLLRLLASYNAGPGGFLRWSATLRDDGDPLLFIEAIPNDETRRFVERALTYTWIYAARLHLPAPSLDDMAAGEFPRFTPVAVRGRIASARLH